MPVDQSKGVYGDDEDGKGEFDFETKWEDPHGMLLKTACCCCVCAVDGDGEDCIQVQEKGVCLWCEGGGSCRCCQCMDESSESLACCQGSGMCKNCSMTDEDKSLVCSNVGMRGVCCCCVLGTSSGRCCDPCGAPESCVKVMSQIFCIHSRSAIPCDEDVPFEIGCCGIMCKEAERADGGHE